MPEDDDWVLAFAARLQEQAGIEVILDKIHYDRNVPWNVFMLDSIRRTDFTLVICTRLYKSKADSLMATNGVGIETLISLQVFYESPAKFIPILKERLENGSPAIPMYLQNFQYFDFSSSVDDLGSFQSLTYALWDAKQIALPPVGARPELSTHLYRSKNITDTTGISDEIAKNCRRIAEEFNAIFNLPDGSASGPLRFIEPKLRPSQPLTGDSIGRISAVSALRDFLDHSDENVLLLLGDYGCGKTSFCYWMAHWFDRLRNQPEKSEPYSFVLLSCRRSKVIPDGSLDAWIDQLLSSGLRMMDESTLVWPFSITALRTYMSLRNVVLVLDGLDETDVASAKAPYENYLRVANYLRSLPCKCIITSRISFLPSLAANSAIPLKTLPFAAVRPLSNMRPVSGVCIVTMTDFDDEALKEYFTQSTLSNAEDKLAAIRKDERIGILARKPIFAALLAQSAISTLESEDGILAVYEEIVVDWISTSRQLVNITADRLRAFLEELAFYMFISNSREIPEREFEQYARLHLKDADPGTFSRVHAEICNETFLVRTAAGHLAFSHNTFAEFLVARKLCAELLQFRNANLYIRLLSDAVNFFLLAYLERAPRATPVLSIERHADMVLIPADSEFNNKIGAAVPSFYIDREPVSNADYLTFILSNKEMLVPFSENRDLLVELCDRDNVDWVVNDIDGYLTSCSRFCWNPSQRMFPEGEDEFPVIYISYYDAWAYAHWRGKRLPTFIEWVKAAAWDPQSRLFHEYGIGNVTPSDSDCNFGGSRRGPVAIGSLSDHRSPYGCVDMSGNVSEWTSDWFDSQRLFKLIVGGAWHMGLEDLLVFHPNRSLPNVRRNFVGMRLVSV